MVLAPAIIIMVLAPAIIIVYVLTNNHHAPINTLYLRATIQQYHYYL